MNRFNIPELTNVRRMPYLYLPEEILDWISKFTVLWNAEFRMSYDTSTHDYVVEIVYRDSSCKSARSKIPAQALQKLIQDCGGLDATTFV